MGVIRLPVSGDYVQAELIVGVSAQGDDCVREGVVTVWVGVEGTLELLQEIYVTGFTEAKSVRDKIVALSGLLDTPLPGGDVVLHELICGVCAQGGDGTLGLTTVWIADDRDTPSVLQTFTHIRTSTVETAIAAREEIAALAGLAEATIDDGGESDEIVVMPEQGAPGSHSSGAPLPSGSGEGSTEDIGGPTLEYWPTKDLLPN